MAIDLVELKRFFGLSAFIVDLGVAPTAVGDGWVHSELAVAPKHLQHTGHVHAGVMATMADHSMGAAAQTLAGPGQWVLTAELKTSLLRPGLGERLWCEAKVLKPGKSISFTEAEVFALVNGERKLVMKASATMALTTPKG